MGNISARGMVPIRGWSGRSRVSWAVGAALLAVCFGSIRVLAGELKITSSASTSLTATDNIDLEPKGEENAGLIWTNSASLGLRSTGDRVDAALDYTVSLDTEFSSDTDVDVRNDLLGFGSIEVVPDHFFIRTQAFAGQQLLNSGGRISASGDTRQGDTANVYSFSATPYFQFGLGSWGEVQAGASHRRVYVDDHGSNNPDNNADNSVSTSEFLTLHNLEELARTKFAFDFEHEDVQAEGEANDSERFTGLASAEYALARWFSLLGTAGYESIETKGLTRDLSGVVGLGGFKVHGPRSELSFSAGHRFGELVYDGSAQYRITPQLRVQGSYGVFFVPAQGGALAAVSDLSVSDLGQIVDSVSGLPIDTSDVGLGLEDNPYIAKRALLALIGDYEPDQLSLVGRFENRDFDGAQPAEDVLGATASWTHTIFANLQFGMSGLYDRTREENGDDSDTIIGRVELIYKLAENASTWVSYAHAERFADLSADEYSENALTIGVHLDF